MPMYLTTTAIIWLLVGAHNCMLVTSKGGTTLNLDRCVPQMVLNPEPI